MTKLKRSNDRKVANLVTKSGKQAAIANTFGLPAGKSYSCPGATSVCESVCYAGKLEKLFKGVKVNLLHNWELLKDADSETMINLLDEMIVDFVADCEKKDAPMLFRIHWDGDFFSKEYTFAWAAVIIKHSDVQFWAYTRSDFAVPILQGISNLGLFFSTDDDNRELGKELKATYGVKLAFLAKTFAIGREGMLSIQPKSAVPCPENNGKLPMISEKGSACVTCSQCVFARNDILFSATKK
jgi:hypothetical protein